MRRKTWIAAGIVLCVLTGAGYWFVKSREFATTASLLKRLPSGDAAVLYLDFDALRRGGLFKLLAGVAVDEEVDYKTFVSKTSFDYARDVDAALVSFHPSGSFLLVRGRFDWPKLEAYAREQGGGCFQTLCRMTGSVPARKISFFPLRPDLMALAVSTDEWAATRMNEPVKNPHAVPVTPQPVWLSLPPAVLKDPSRFPEGTQLFAKAMQDAESAVFSLGPDGQTYVVKLDVLCASDREAAIVTAQCQKITTLVGQLIASEGQKPDPSGLSGVLMSGVFRQQERRVLGEWKLPRGFFETLAGKPPAAKSE